MAQEDGSSVLASLGRPVSPPINTWIREPGFGTSELTVQRLNKFCDLLSNMMDPSKSTSYIPAIVCYALNCSGVEWEDLIGHIRSILYYSTQQSCPLLPDGHKMFQIGPRKPLFKDKIRQRWVIDVVKAKHAFLRKYDTRDEPHAEAWIQRMLIYHITHEATWLNNNYEAITNGLKCRSDQNDSMKWSGAKLGKTMLSTTGQTIQDRSSEIARPDPASKRNLAACHLVITRCNRVQPPTAVDGSIPSATSVLVKKSKSIKMAELCEAAAEAQRLAQSSTAGTSSSNATTRKAAEFPIDFLLKTCIKEFNIPASDEVVIAWQNPYTFFGRRDVLCAIRTPGEFEIILDELKKIHLLSTNDDRLFLYLVKKDMCVDEKEIRKEDDVESPTRTPTVTSQTTRAASKRLLPADSEVGRGQGKKRKTYTPSTTSTPSP